MPQNTLYYVHDPMCSWCYAYQPVFKQIEDSLTGTVAIHKILGGLAPDSDETMPATMQQTIQDTWSRIIARVPGTSFNFKFWSRCQPRRSTYPACRAVIAAKKLGNYQMTTAIQNAYYQQARNPSDSSTLINIASEIGLDSVEFTRQLRSPEVEEELQRQIAFSRSIGADSFPSLVLEVDGSRWPIAIDYNHAEPTLELIEQLCHG